MKWECPPTRRNNLCSSSEAARFGRRKTGGGGWWWWRGDGVESCALYPVELLWTFMLLVWFTCVFVPAGWEASNPTTPLSQHLPSSIRSASVRKCLRTFHGAERQRRASSFRGVQPCICNYLQISEVFIRLLKSLLCDPVGSRRVHIAQRNVASGAHRWVRTARCQRSQSARIQTGHPAPQLDPKIPEVRFATHPSGLPATSRCAVFDSGEDGFVCTVVLGGEEGTRAGLRRLSFPLHA